MISRRNLEEIGLSAEGIREEATLREETDAYRRDVA